MITPSTRGTTMLRLPPPPMKYPVEVKAVTNDPTQKATVHGRSVTISGTAANDGIVPSFMQFDVAGKKIDLQLSRGMSPMQTMKALERKLPKGYQVQLLSTPRPGNSVIFQIDRTAIRG